FNAEELLLLFQGNSLAKVIKANTDITNLQQDVFHHLVGQDGDSKNFYTTTAGRTELTGSATGTTLSGPLYDSLVAALANPDQPGKLVLVDSSGNYVSATSLQSYSFVKSFLQNANIFHPANLLSAQLLTAQLNISLGKVSATASVYAPAINLMP